MKKHSIEAQRLLDELDAELAANGAAAGRSLGWSASERQIISMAADAIDRGVELAAAYAEAVDVKDKIKVSRRSGCRRWPRRACSRGCRPPCRRRSRCARSRPAMP
jgi:hypothetical protein